MYFQVSSSFFSRPALQAHEALQDAKLRIRAAEAHAGPKKEGLDGLQFCLS